jgi:hypothetical protein
MASTTDYNNQISNLINTYNAGTSGYQKDLGNQYGLPTKQADLDSIRKSAMETDKMLADLPTQLKQRTGGMLMTQGQLGRVQATESAPLAQTLANLNRNESVAQTGLTAIQKLIDDALAQRQGGFNTQLGELQNQRNLQATAEQAQLARDAAMAQWNQYQNNQPKASTDTGLTAAQIADYEKRLQDEINKNKGGSNTIGTGIFDRIGNIGRALLVPPILSYTNPQARALQGDYIKQAFPEIRTIQNIPSNIGSGLGGILSNALANLKSRLKK